MCNLYSQTKAAEAIASLFRQREMPLSFPEGVPNLQARDVRITETAPIVRAGLSPGTFDLIQRRWSWPGPGGKPVYNFRSDGREFDSGRCLILTDGFYEFTAPADPKSKRKDRWLFTPLADGLMAGTDGLIGIAGLVRDAPGIGQAFTMLTTAPGPDLTPFHHRQVALVPPSAWQGWLDGSLRATDALGPVPAGTLEVSASVAA
ncbi:MAG: SOS response-associated peptidase family protein [Sphingomicrobium sp.]